MVASRYSSAEPLRSIDLSGFCRRPLRFGSDRGVTAVCADRIFSTLLKASLSKKSAKCAIAGIRSPINAAEPFIMGFIPRSRAASTISSSEASMSSRSKWSRISPSAAADVAGVNLVRMSVPLAATYDACACAPNRSRFWILPWRREFAPPNALPPTPQ